MIKAVFVDMDGTLLNNEPRVSEKNARAIKEFQEKEVSSSSIRDGILSRPPNL